jgi:L-2-hydroxyglutarate oxidase LhgO
LSLDFDTAVIGAGAVGLACAAVLSSRGRSVVILEADSAIARHGTARNSEVIHASIYYPAGSLKARLCRRGCDLVYARAQARGIPHRRTGKLVVAAGDDEVPRLAALHDAARANGVPQLEMIDAATLHRIEPDVSGVAALSSPVTGIVDAHALALSYLAEAEENGAALLIEHRVTELAREREAWRVVVRVGEGGDEQSVRCSEVVNAAGMGAHEVAASAGIDIDREGLRVHLCKGDYFALAPGAPVSLGQLIYPVGSAEGAGLGVHATLDLAGRIRFGPDATYVDAPDYTVAAAKAPAFAEAVRRYLPAIEDDWLTPDFAGLRTKLAGPGEGFRDFEIREESAQGLPGLVNCIGIESPGLTASGAIAEYMADRLDAR